VAYAIQWLRSLIFNFLMYVVLGIIGIGFAPWALFSREGSYAAINSFCWWVVWSASWMVGLKTEIRGEIPDDGVLVAAKHQSFFDILIIFGALPRGKFIMKSSLVWAPIVGQYGLRIGCVPVDRGKRGAAIKKMVADVKSGAKEAGQLIIFSQGTRVAAGDKKPYKVGTGVLYRELKQDCVPVATNVGVFWPRHGVYRAPGVAVVEFLPRIKAGMKIAPFMAELEETVEAASDSLMAEAGFVGKENK